MSGMSTFSEAKVKRQAAGSSVGGQFAVKANSAPGVSLTPVASAMPGGAGNDEFARRRQEYLERGYVPASGGRSRSGSIYEVERRDEWWDEMYDRAEIVKDGAEHTKMPDDWSPSMGTGQALSGRRRTYRKRYDGPDVSLRMPSATAIRSFSKANKGRTFDIPVQAEGKGGSTVTGYVRVTQTAPGKWSTQALNMPPKVAAKVGEAVNAVLESRRPTTALLEAGDLLERRRQRAELSGAKMEQATNSRFITGYGYNKAAGEIVVEMGERRYGYKVPEGVFNAMKSSRSAGEAYNNLIRKNPDVERFETKQCDVCGRWWNADRSHECGGQKPPRKTHTLYSKRLQRRAQRKAERSAVPA